jgi:hypothetical protein
MDKAQLTRYGLYTVSHERRIKPMPEGQYYLASDADQREAAAVAAAHAAGRQDALNQVSVLLGLSAGVDLAAILQAGTADAAEPSSIDDQDFRDIVHAYAAYPSDIKPLVAFIERYKDTAVGRAVQTLSNALGGAGAEVT